MSTALEVWTETVARHGSRPFLREPGGDRTYLETDHDARRIAGSLRSAGVPPGAHVAVIMDNDPVQVCVLLALVHLGAVAVPLMADSSHDELAYAVADSGASWLVHDATTRAHVDGIAGLAVPPPRRIVIGSPPDGARLAASCAADDEARPGPDSPLAIVYTSGSTGRPRGVVVPQRAFGVTGSALAERFGYRADDTVLCVLPLPHLSATLMSMAPAVAVGAGLAVVPRFSRSGFWAFVAATGATVTIVVPTIVEILLRAAPHAGDTANDLRLLVTHRPCPEFADRFGVEVCSLWGMTETSGLGLSTVPGEAPGDPSSIGRPYPPDAEVTVLGADGVAVRDGEVGELVFGHRAVMLGYRGDDASGVERRVRSGDLVRRDEHGIVHYVGRIKNMIKRGGESVAAQEVERVLSAHPGVGEVCVLGVPDPVYVEEICAVVVPVPGHDLDPGDVRAWCAEAMARWKVPRYVVVRRSPLPTLPNLKVDRAAVRADVSSLT